MKQYSYNRWLLSLAILIGCCFTQKASAGVGEQFFTVSGGFLFPQTLNAEFSFEKELRHGNALELTGEIGNKWQKDPVCGKVCSESFWKGYYWGGGIAYKPVLKKYKNSALRLKTGLHCGAYTKKWCYGGQISFEYVFFLPSGLQFSITQKNQININHGDTFRNGILLGVRIPIN